MKTLKISMAIPLVAVFFITTVCGFKYVENKKHNTKYHQQEQAPVTADDIKFLHSTLKKHGILFGSLISPADITLRAPRPQNYLTEVAKYFNFYTMSVSYQIIEPKQQGVFNFDLADKTVEFAMANNAKVKGHALVTAASLPAWLTNGNFSADQLKSILKNHIQTTVKHFKDKYPGQVIEWNVVNEPICNQGDSRDSEKCSPEGIKYNIWSAIHKPGSTDPSDYIQYALEWAHEADPSAKLFINENGIEFINDPKKQRLYNLVKSLVSKGEPINGIGFESHVPFYKRNLYSAEALTAEMDRYAALGLESQVSELDVAMTMGAKKVNSFTASVQLAMNNLQQPDFQSQGDVYSMFLKACLNAKNCTGFTTWGPWDTGTYMNLHWKGNFYPHLLDDGLKPKLAFKCLVDEAKKHR